MYIKITQAPYGNSTNRWLDSSVSNEEHHGLKCISSSQLKYLASGKSPYNFYAKYVEKSTPREFIDAFMIGTLAHLAVLEPEKFEKSVIICDLDQRTNEFKEFRKSLAKPQTTLENNQQLLDFEINIQSLAKELEEATSKEQTKVIKDKLKRAKQELKIIEDSQPKDDFKVQFTKDGGFINAQGQETFLVKNEEMNMFRAYQKQFDNHKRLSVMIPDCEIEQSGVAQDPETGLWMSLRGDARSSRGYFIDPKTVADELSEKSIEQYCINYHLSIQAAHYIDTANEIEPGIYKKFFFVMMSKKPPYEIAFIQLDSEATAFGKRKRREMLRLIADCESSGKWPHLDYNNANHGLIISLPPWGLR